MSKKQYYFSFILRIYLLVDEGNIDGGFFSCIRLWLGIVEQRAVCEKTEPHLAVNLALVNFRHDVIENGHNKLPDFNIVYYNAK